MAEDPIHASPSEPDQGLPIMGKDKLPPTPVEALIALYNRLEEYGATVRAQSGGVGPAALTIKPTTNGIYHRLHPQVGNVEYLVALNPDVDLAANIPITSAADERARWFLIQNFRLFSFSSGQAAKSSFRRQLYLVNQLSSRLGTRCTFGMQLNGLPTSDSYVVHLDPDNRVVMVSAVYHPPSHPEETQEQLNELRKGAIPRSGPPARNDGHEARASDTPLEEALRTWLKDQRKEHDAIAELIQIKPALVQDWSTPTGGQQVLAYEVHTTVERNAQKANAYREPYRFIVASRPVTPERGGWTFELLSDHPLAASLAPFGLGRIYGDFWAPANDLAADDSQAAAGLVLDVGTLPAPPSFGPDQLTSERKTVEVLLRGLDESPGLTGCYAFVDDKLATRVLTGANLFLDKPSPTSTAFDRQMVYYHIDLIQRYFRQLGLELLDRVPGLNPLSVVLMRNGATRYAYEERAIIITTVFGLYTHARDPRVLYHEYVHAVTAALAGLDRAGQGNAKDGRYLQMIQAASCDEGSADYFACSLAARNGAPNAHLYVVRRENEALDASPITWHRMGGRRILGGAGPDYAPYTAHLKPEQALAQEVAALQGAGKSSHEIFEQLIYHWGEQWARYLWKLRQAYSPDVVDTIVAHSFLLLSRTASFGHAVLALALADQLLFGGNHQEAILKPWEQIGGWQTTPPPQAMAPTPLTTSMEAHNGSGNDPN